MFFYFFQKKKLYFCETVLASKLILNMIMCFIYNALISFFFDADGNITVYSTKKNDNYEKKNCSRKLENEHNSKRSC